MIKASVFSGPLFCLAALFLLHAQSAVAGPREATPQRLISLSPSITGTLVFLGLEDRLVGITDWCEMPDTDPQPLRVGGHVDPVIEAVYSLRPDLVIIEMANGGPADDLERLRLNVLRIDHRTLEGILSSVVTIADACGIRQHADSLLTRLRERQERASIHSSGSPPPGVLIFVGRNIATGHIQEMFAAGSESFLGQLVSEAGGRNLAPGNAIGYPVLSREAVLRLDPEVILDLAPEYADDPVGLSHLRSAWDELSRVNAVRTGRVYILTDQRMLVPDPGFVDTLEMMSQLLYPQESAHP